MAKLCVVSVFDGAVQAHMRPMYVPSKGYAIRSFSDEVKRSGTDDQPNMMNKHPADYELRFLGTWDEETGIHQQVEGTQVLIRAADVAQ